MIDNKTHIKPKFSWLLLTSIVCTAIGLLSFYAVVFSWIIKDIALVLVYYLVVFPAFVICCLAVLYNTPQKLGA